MNSIPNPPSPKRPRRKRAPDGQRTWISLICQQCGKPFQAQVNWAQRAKFCSHPCYWQSRRLPKFNPADRSTIRSAHGERQYRVNEFIFENIGTEAVSYLLGWITADGCVTDRGLLQFGVARRDEGHLLKIRDVLGSNHPIRRTLHQAPNGRWFPESELRLSSQRIVADLHRLGIVARKSLIAQPWQGSPELMPHYYRGLIDGDGSWFKPKGGLWRLSLVGTLAMVEGFSQFVEQVAGYRPVAHPGHGRVWSTTVSRLPAVQAVARTMYHGATIWLDRKKSKVDMALVAEATKRTCRQDTTKEDLLRLRAEHGSWESLAQSWGVSASTVLSLARRRGILRHTRDFTWLTAGEYVRLLDRHGSHTAVAMCLGMLPEQLYKIRCRLGLAGPNLADH